MLYKNDPRIISAKFNCVCAESKKPISKGEQCIYYPRHRQVFHMDSAQATDYFNWRADINQGYNY